MGLKTFPNAPESEKSELTWGSKHEDHEALHGPVTVIIVMFPVFQCISTLTCPTLLGV